MEIKIRQITRKEAKLFINTCSVCKEEYNKKLPLFLLIEDTKELTSRHIYTGTSLNYRINRLIEEYEEEIEELKRGVKKC